MYQTVIDIISKETLRLINEQADGIFLPLLQTPGLFNNCDEQGNLSENSIKHWTNVIKDEAYKVKRSEVTFVVIGTMKSGKSTTINAIIGNELLPNRNQPMTILPTIITHCAGKIEPELVFSNPQPFNEIIDTLHQKLKVKEAAGELDQISFYNTMDGRELIRKIIDKSFKEVRQFYQGNTEIFTFLKYINDIWRLCNSVDIGLDAELYLNHYRKMEDLPRIEVEFFHLKEQNFQGRFTLIDTPGPNEAGQFFLKNIVTEQVEKASAIIVILDYTQMNAEAELEIYKSLQAITHITQNRMFALVNKFDQKDRNGMSVETLRSYIATQLFAEEGGKKRVFPVSSKYAYLANRALSELGANGKLSNCKTNPWIEDFGQLALGACWESEIDDIQEVEYRANKLWKSSYFDDPLAEIIKNGSENAAVMSLKSAIAKMLDYDKKIMDGILLRINALTSGIDTIENEITCLEKDISLVKKVGTDLRTIFDNSIETLHYKFYLLVDNSAALLEEEMQFEFNLYNYEDFSQEAEARQMLAKLIEAVSVKLRVIQQEAKKSVDEVLENIGAEFTRPLETVLETAGERLFEAFSVKVDFPSPSILISFDPQQIFYNSIKRESVMKMGVMLERKWYTLWSHEHKHKYQYKEQVYRIYTKDVLGILQKVFLDDSDGIWRSLDQYVRTEFNEAMNAYFMAGYGYLERIKGDLLQAKHDQELKGERMAELKQAMHTIFKQAETHRKDVELLGKGFLMRGREKVAI
ncbi:MAG: dynamin family protein [Pelosinus sp.]|nr:dynamin family protein [Pelosinus sp.]